MNTDTIHKLLRIRSTADNSTALQEAVAVITDILERHAGITVEKFESHGKPSLLAYTGQARPKHFTVLLNGHVDVVPAKPEQFEPVEKGGKLYGRGALDMKSAALVLTETFCELAPKLPYTLGL